MFQSTNRPPVTAPGAERALATSSPRQQLLVAIVTAQPCRGFVEQPEDHRAIVVGKIDEAGLGDQPAELDELPRTLAARHLPGAVVMTRLFRQQSVALRADPAERFPALLQARGQWCGRLKRMRSRAGAMPPSSRCRW